MGDTHFSGKVVGSSFEQTDGTAITASTGGKACITLYIGDVAGSGTVSRTCSLPTGLQVSQVHGVSYMAQAVAIATGLEISVGYGSTGDSLTAYLDAESPATDTRVQGTWALNGNDTDESTEDICVRVTSTGATSTATGLALMIWVTMDEAS